MKNLQSNKGKIKIVMLTCLVALLGVMLTACGGGSLSGTYESGQGEEITSIRFERNGNLRITESGEFYDGTYRREGNTYYLEIRGPFGIGIVLTATKNGKDLLISGGGIMMDFNNERFVRR